jgi:hypothetical protein
MKPTREQVTKEFWWQQIDPDSEDFEKVFKPTACGTLTQPSFLIWHWNFGQDYAAYSYELARRASPKFSRLRPYPELGAEEADFLFRAFGTNKARKAYGPIIRKDDPALPLAGRPGYSRPAIFRLDAPNNTLINSFELFIEQERKTYGITLRKTPGSTSKPPPWKHIELYSMATLINDSSGFGSDPARTLRKAKSDAKKFINKIKSQRAQEIGLNQNLRNCLWPDCGGLL